MKNKVKTLIVVDVQNDFVTGLLGTDEAKKAIPSIKEKIEKYSKTPNYTIIYTQDTHYEDYLETQEGKNLPVPHCISGTEGWKVVPFVDNNNWPHLCKPTFGFGGWGFAINEDEVEEIELIGFCTDICVVSNALLLKAQFPEIKITVDASCCAGVTPEKHATALEVMKSCQINVINE